MTWLNTITLLPSLTESQNKVFLSQNIQQVAFAYSGDFESCKNMDQRHPKYIKGKTTWSKTFYHPSYYYNIIDILDFKQFIQFSNRIFYSLLLLHIEMILTKYFLILNISGKSTYLTGFVTLKHSQPSLIHRMSSELTFLE